MNKRIDLLAAIRRGVALSVSLGGLVFSGSSTASTIPAWMPDTDYAAGAIVSYRGQNYESTVTHRDHRAKGESPSNGGQWRRIGSRGGDNGNGDFRGFHGSVVVFDPSMSSDSIQAQLDNLYASQKNAPFDRRRIMLLFKPGSYNNTVRLGYYMQAAGLGESPDDVVINGDVEVDASEAGSEGVPGFWRTVENLAVVPAGGTMTWAASEATALRRLHVRGNLALPQNSVGVSGGFIADSAVDGRVDATSQQQWLSRNSSWQNWIGGGWNMVFVGDYPAPLDNVRASSPYTVVGQSPVIREKPYLTVDSSDDYSVFVPAPATNASGTSWANGGLPGETISIKGFYVATPGVDTARSLNRALAKGSSLLLTPGIYRIDQPLKVIYPDTVILGMGLATLRSVGGSEAMIVSDVDGVNVAGVVFEAGPRGAPVLLRVGSPGSRAAHAADPISLHDLYFHVDSSATASTASGLEINSRNVIGDELWISGTDRATVGVSAVPAVNRGGHGLVVNGRDVTLYGLTVEHFQDCQPLWNGDGGRVYFFHGEQPEPVRTFD